MLAELPVQLISLGEAGISYEVEETGTTFQENAALKAETYASISGNTCLADDSGIVIDALNGEPGIHSARFAGPDATDEQRVLLVLKRMHDVPSSRRTAEFVCAIAVCVPNRPAQVVESRVNGVITDEPRGSRGFGYDPIFNYPPAGQTFAEMPDAEKGAVSHRALALKAALPLICELIQAGILG